MPSSLPQTLLLSLALFTGSNLHINLTYTAPSPSEDMPSPPSLYGDCEEVGSPHIPTDRYYIIILMTQGGLLIPTLLREEEEDRYLPDILSNSSCWALGLRCFIVCVAYPCLHTGQYFLFKSDTGWPTQSYNVPGATQE